MRAILFLCALASCGYSADVCNPAELIGPYAVQLSGTTTISGVPKPTASLARVVFDGHGNLSGTASAMFAGFLLGNPITGTYEAKSDCTVSWKLQDDSGAFQNFSGTFSGDLMHGQFKQTDAGGAERGIMLKSSDNCTAAQLQKEYSFTVSGDTIPMGAGDRARTISARGTLYVDDIGTFQVDRDCTVRFALTLPATKDEMGMLMQMRGVLVKGGKEILAVQTDPGAMVAARLTSTSVAH